jgi:glycosyltransferase involved in cell wall biosynthesis
MIVSGMAPASPLGRSRELILEAIGPASEPALVSVARAACGELAAAGARALLAGRQVRELPLAELPGAEGELVLFAGAADRGGDGPLPRALGVAALRFRRVIVLPAPVFAHDDALLAALSRVSVTVFVSDPGSQRLIAPLCDARLAHDCSFYVDYGPYAREGVGTLEASADALDTLPLEDWLATIAAHELISTDRAPVMIAAALLGKRVEYRGPSDGLLDWTATHPLAGRPLTRTGATAVGDGRPSAVALAPQARETLRLLELAARDGGHADPRSGAAGRVTAVVLTRDRPGMARRALDSLARGAEPPDVLVIDNNSAPDSASALAAECAARANVRLHRTERNLGCAGGRRAGAELARSELILFLDDDAELLPGALDHLLAALDGDPRAAAVAATVVTPDGLISHSGGSFDVADGVASFALIGSGRRFSPVALPASGPADWVPGTAVLIRRELLETFPLDDGMAAYYEDNEWCYRVSRDRDGAFRRSREALALHHLVPKRPDGPSFDARSLAVELLAAQARFYERHRLLLGPWLFHLVPELTARDGSRDLAGARVLMELVAARGTDWMFAALANGELAGLLGAGAVAVELGSARRLLERTRADRDANQRRVGAMRERLEHADDELELARGQIEWLERYAAGQDQQIAWLSQRSETLTQIEEGGWWRLRGRLLPLLRIVGWLRNRR